MIKISRATKEQAMRYADFFRPEVSGGGGFEDNILYLGYDDDTLEVVCAASVYPALEGAHLTGICVAKERQRQGIGRQLINTIAEDLGLVYAVNEGSLPRIIVEESMDRDMVICLDPFLVKCGFSEK
ncbi:MAG: GNAT family N-acetyltransferase, partial [Lachnospiraceae bacterium]|nr:GNAT family N-acetyltransferase [Lachnospiraceae bacterium]